MGCFDHGPRPLRAALAAPAPSVFALPTLYPTALHLISLPLHPENAAVQDRASIPPTCLRERLREGGKEMKLCQQTSRPGAKLRFEVREIPRFSKTYSCILAAAAAVAYDDDGVDKYGGGRGGLGGGEGGNDDDGDGDGDDDDYNGNGEEDKG
eukprot:287245-Hanusia_phi.AAC.2